MRQEKRSLRQEQIETAAYEILETRGYGGTSMQSIAKTARASNETLYRWYGDKQGLFLALVARNAADVKDSLETELQTDHDGLSILHVIGPKLLRLLTGDRAVALNRAAAADSTGELGGALSKAGRESVVPLLEQVLLRAREAGQLGFDDTSEAVALYLDLLIGDQQIRRVIGRLPAPSVTVCEDRSKRAVRHLRVLLQS
ncbi:TetR family transcriptional regulator [Roseobacter cerasinus]|uniref:TetR family transcriptional regulator n=1 Tax=Roseobacter cerasinus TaxID=2602289 RepID=A0A640VP91_9RHOB|nr:TetR/AcrR family transcriptional regulator [Roseobacter cerasinus]GFE49492.1 TetR family transcriptional regulator [Roseobacter cerasinus]